jgi:hypothetical protein
VEALPEVVPPVENPPDAVQDVVFVEFQVSTEDCPLSMVLGRAEIVAVGESAHEFELWLQTPPVQR